MIRSPAAPGVDADRDMLDEAALQATRAGIEHVTWRHLRAEQLPADVAEPSVVTFARSFHWTDRPRVASIVRSMLAEGGGARRGHDPRGGDTLSLTM